MIPFLARVILLLWLPRISGYMGRGCRYGALWPEVDLVS